MTPHKAYGSINIDTPDIPYVRITNYETFQLPTDRWRKHRVGLAFGVAAAIFVVCLVVPNSRPRLSELVISSGLPISAEISPTFPEEYFPPNGKYHSPLERKRYFKHQPLDNFHKKSSEKKWSNRYYEDLEFFGGPGHPIFVILGGEDALENMLYPFITRVLARHFNAVSIAIEHRFYGESLPVKKPTSADFRRLLSTAQALADAINIIKYKQEELGCGPRGSDTYCPVMTVGGSYPGFMSFLMRFVYPDVVDIGYASSAPLHLYSHDVSQDAYYDKITQVAEQSSPGCAGAIKQVLTEVKEDLLASEKHVSHEAKRIGVCGDRIPGYIKTNKLLIQEILIVIATRFAENNMDYYPPGPDQDFFKACKIFQDDELSAKEKVSEFLRMPEDFDECFDMMSELPPGPYGRITNSDWSGVGGGQSGLMWDFQCCTLAPEIGFSDVSMFPPRRWSMDDLTNYCQKRFDYTPHRDALVDYFKFDDLSNATRVLFTNGINDGWSVASILVQPSEGTRMINFPNGAHHSDLSHVGPSEADTNDIMAGYGEIADIVGGWLDEVRNEQP